MTEIKADGLTFNFEGEEKIRTDLLKTFPFDSPAQRITTETHEFSAVCPFSGLPDVADVTLIYKPTGGRCVELKSLKYYFTSFRNVGIYQEGVTKRIQRDLSELLGTDVFVRTTYRTRGGFDTICEEGSVTA